MAQGTFLQVQRVSKSFGGVMAVRDVSFDLQAGEIFGIIGPNGSGKTTLVNLLTGFEESDRGKVIFKGTDITGLPPYKIARLGLTRTFQIMRPYHTLPVFKNLIVPLVSSRARKLGRGKLGDRDNVAIDLLEEIGFERDSSVPYKLASALPQGYLKRLELARCLALNPEIIIADELFSGLSMSEVATMLPLVEKLQMQGITIIMVEHRLRELFRLTNRVMVLNFGEKIAEGTAQYVMSQEQVKEAYLGLEVS